MIRFPLFSKLVLAVFAGGAVSLSTALAGAQDEEPASEEGAIEAPGGGEAAQPEVVTAAADEGEDADAAGEDQRSEIDELKEQVEALTARMDAADDARLDAMGATREFEPSLDVYGFMAFYAGKWFIEEDNVLHGIMHNKLTFGVTDVNVYFSGHLTETLSSLLELRFTFLPNGADASYIPVYDRVDTHYVNANTSETLALGGVIIERAKIEWQPYDYFGITVGRFLTPFGIWNIDHGAPVVIPINKPYLMLRHLMPLAQTGFAIQGRFFPAASTYFDYVVTLSNGRGPTEEVYDLDENKAVGLRLRLSYEGQDVGFSLGTYGYFGHTTDNTKEPDFGGGGIEEFAMREVTTSRYQEMAGSVDLLLRLWNFRIQSEAAGGLLKYEVRPIATVPVIEEESPLGEYQPDFYKWNVYLMLAYEIPIRSGDKEMFLTPFLLAEYDVMYDSLPEYNTWVWRGGLNFKPNSFVVLKLDGTYVWLSKNGDIDPIWSIGLQVALTF